MRYVKSRYIEWHREEAYRNYVCDSLRLQGEHKYIANRYSDFVNPKPVVSNAEAMKSAINALKVAGVTIT